MKPALIVIDMQHYFFREILPEIEVNENERVLYGNEKI